MRAKEIKKCACVGAGVIGYSWAVSFALNGIPTKVYDITEDSLKLAKERVHTSLELLRKNKVITKAKMAKIESKISYTTDMKEAVSDAMFIAESGPENYEIKQKMVAEIEQ